MSDGCHSHSGQELIWDYYQNEAPESFEGSRTRLQFLIKRIHPPAAVLNIGCGSGLFERLALRQGLEVYSLDPSEKSIQGLKSALQLGDRAKVGYIQKIPFPDCFFDAVVVSEVLEHLTTELMRQGLVDIRRVLKPGGRIIGTVPSRENLKEQTVVCPCCGKRFHRWGHEQSFEATTLRDILSEYFGMVTVVERPFFAWATLNWKGKLLGAIKFFLLKIGSHGSNESIFFEGIESHARRDPE
ncbi:MAG: hypothetical protein DME18_06505 [Verrucomicrobia bacterium]|nr:MAG: hypothetical protein DME18_06505 [Verrucomicrobiota bacterium]